MTSEQHDHTAHESALNAIVEVAEALLLKTLPPDVDRAVQLILSIARHRTDVRSTQGD